MKLQLLPLPPPSAPLLQDFADFIALPCFTKLQLSQGLQHANRLVRYYSQLLLLGVLRARERLPTELESRTDFVHQLTEEIRQRLPDLQVIIAQLPRAALHQGSAGVDLLLKRGAQLVSYYQRYLPVTMHGANFDVASLLTTNPSSPADLLPAHLLLPLLRALQATHAIHDLLQDSNVLTLVLRVLTWPPSAGTYSAAYAVLRQSLLQSELFQGTVCFLLKKKIHLHRMHE